MNKTALITGITGQDGSYLAELLLEKEYKIYGLIRYSSTDNTWRIRRIIDNIELVNGDLSDQASLDKAISLIKPDEIYNLAAQSFVKVSWESPEFTFNVNATGVIRLLEAVRSFGKKETKVYQASSSEQFGKALETPQNENTKFYPRSIYGCSKAAAHYICVNYRESYNMFISCGISFNHESYRRSLEFVSRKISYGVAKISLGLGRDLSLGNLEPKRDWGHAPEFVGAFWKILQLDMPVDLVLATGETHSIKEFVIEAFNCVGINNWQEYVRQDLKYMRPAEVNLLLGDSSNARNLIGWYPLTKFKDLVNIMVQADIGRLRRGEKFE